MMGRPRVGGFGAGMLALAAAMALGADAAPAPDDEPTPAESILEYQEKMASPCRPALHPVAWLPYPTPRKKLRSEHQGNLGIPKGKCSKQRPRRKTGAHNAKRSR